MCHFTVEGLIIVQKYVMELRILQWDSNRYIGSDCEPVFITAWSNAADYPGCRKIHCWHIAWLMTLLYMHACLR